MTRSRAPGDGDSGVWQCWETDVMDGGVLQPDQHKHQITLHEPLLLPGPLDDVSLDGGPRLESVQLLPVTGKLGVSPGGGETGSEAEEGEDHREEVRDGD